MQFRMLGAAWCQKEQCWERPVERIPHLKLDFCESPPRRPRCRLAAFLESRTSTPHPSRELVSGRVTPLPQITSTAAGAVNREVGWCIRSCFLPFGRPSFLTFVFCCSSPFRICVPAQICMLGWPQDGPDASICSEFPI